MDGNTHAGILQWEKHQMLNVEIRPYSTGPYSTEYVRPSVAPRINAPAHHIVTMEKPIPNTKAIFTNLMIFFFIGIQMPKYMMD